MTRQSRTGVRIPERRSVGQRLNIGLSVVAPALEHDDPRVVCGERPGDGQPHGPGADDANVGIEGCAREGSGIHFHQQNS